MILSGSRICRLCRMDEAILSRFDPLKFAKERRIVRALVARCMGKLAKPGLVTTTTEEVVWIAEWCHRHRVPYRVGKRYYPTAFVGDPICFIHIGKGKMSGQASENLDLEAGLAS